MDTVTDGDPLTLCEILTFEDAETDSVSDIVDIPDEDADGDILIEVVGDDNTLTEGNED